MAFGAADVQDQCLLQYSSGFPVLAVGKGSGRDVALQLSFHYIPEQRLKNQCHAVQSEQGCMDSLN